VKSIIEFEGIIDAKIEINNEINDACKAVQ